MGMMITPLFAKIEKQVAEQAVEKQQERERQERERRRRVRAQEVKRIRKFLQHTGRINLGKAGDSRRILRKIAHEYGISAGEITGPTRRREITRIRHEAMWRYYRDTDYTLAQIGKIFNRDHTSVLYGSEKFRKENGLPLPERREGLFENQRRKNWRPNTSCTVCGRPLYRDYPDRPGRHFCSAAHAKIYRYGHHPEARDRQDSGLGPNI